MKIEVDGLTTCCVDEKGTFVELNFLDASGKPITLHVPFYKAQAIAMTLPTLLTLAVQRMTGDAQARYAYPLSGWRIEDTPQHNQVITTFSTDDGFEVSFSLPIEACSGLGWALKEEADRGREKDGHSPDLLKSPRLN